MGRKKINFDYVLFICCYLFWEPGEWVAGYILLSYIMTGPNSELFIELIQISVSTQESFFGRIQGYLKEPRTGSQCSFGQNWSPKKSGDLEAKVILSCCFTEAECFPLCPSLCMFVRPTASSGCSGLPGSAWRRLSVQTSTGLTKSL